MGRRDSRSTSGERLVAGLVCNRVLALVTAVAVVGFGAAVITRAGAGEWAGSGVFTSGDVGFAEGGIRASMVDEFDGMDAYVGAKKPIVRVDLNWGHVEETPCPNPCPGGMQWDQIDPIVDAASARGMRVLVVLAYAPSWAAGHDTGNWFPTDDRDWVDIVDSAVRHFGSRAQAYEVWNEPNLTPFADYGTATTRQQRIADRKKRYWELVKLAYPVVKAACPTCAVVAGASAPAGDPPTAAEMNDNPNTAARWLRAGYAAGARGSLDAVAYHPYPAANSALGPNQPQCDYYFWNGFGPPFYTDPATGKRCGGELAEVRDVMVAGGDSAKKIWGTEIGYPTAGAGIPVLPLTAVRNYLLEAVYMWRALDYTGPLFLYSYQDQPAGVCATDTSSSECHYGVTTAGGVPKEPLYSDMSVALRGDFSSRLRFNQVLRRLSALRSDDSRFYLWLQGDGNLVLYQAATPTTPSIVLWKVVNRNGTRLILQADGNLVLQNPQQQAVWDSHSYQGPDRTATLILQNDGNLVLYRDSDGAPIWDTGTWGH